MPYLRILVLALLLFPVPGLAALFDEERPVIGWVENVTIGDAKMTLKARIDTGAGLASVHADVLEVHPAKGKTPERVSFRILGPDGPSRTLDRPVEKWINIKAKGGKGHIRRPVVKLHLCFGGEQVYGRVNLATREGFLYPMLIGRNLLKAGDFMIDPEKTFMHKKSCKPEED